MSFTEEVKKDAKIINNELKGKDNYLTSSTVLAGIAVVIIVVMLIVQYVSTSNLLKRALNYLRQQEQITTSIPAPTPTPIPLPRGPREFGVSGGDNPQITDLRFSEYYPKVGEEQIITISVSGREANVVKVEIIYMSDHQTITYPLKLTKGTEKEGDWSITLSAKDTMYYRYGMDIRARNSKGQTSIIQPRFR
jgi:hypothetical protein